MRRVLRVWAIASAGAASLAVAAPAESVAAASTAPAPRSELQGLVCHQASTTLDRWISITAVMRPVSGTQRLSLKIELLSRAQGATAFTKVHGGDLGKWRYPTDPPTLGQRPDDVWQLTKEVVNLDAPASYRFRVVFRWLGANEQVLGTTPLLSRVCDQS